MLTLTLDRVILHTIVHHSLTSTYVPNFTEIEEMFCGWTDMYARTDGRTFETSLLPKNRENQLMQVHLQKGPLKQ